MQLSVVLAAFNEEENIGDCLQSVKDLADEIVVVDGSSSDKTVEIAKKFGAKIIITKNEKNFHINKQKAINQAQGEWILQLDADERVTPELAGEIKKVIGMSQEEIEKYQKNLPERELFIRHQSLTNPKSEYRNSKQIINSNDQNSKQKSFEHFKFGSLDLLRTSDLEIRICKDFSAFYIPRKNYFLGKFLRYGGVYPDGVIRLIRKGKARLPCKDVHELMEVDGKTGWLQNPLLHFDSPTFKRYLERNSRYVDLLAGELFCSIKHKTGNTKENKKNLLPHVTCYMLHIKTFIDWAIIRPIGWFLATTLIHKGVLDGWQGIVFSFFSALRFPRAYWGYIRHHKLR